MEGTELRNEKTRHIVVLNDDNHEVGNDNNEVGNDHTEVGTPGVCKPRSVASENGTLQIPKFR